jgi:hypothetical protein
MTPLASISPNLPSSETLSFPSPIVIPPPVTFQPSTPPPALSPEATPWAWLFPSTSLSET